VALKLKLKPGERVVINGAVIVNGDRATTITLQNFAQIVRETDVMQEDEADTPVKRTYYVAQLMLLDDEHAEQYRPRFDALMADLQGVFINPEVRSHLDVALAEANGGNYYKAMAALRKVMKYETLLFASAKLRDSE
jgi:flagellar protein FlbT